MKVILMIMFITAVTGQNLVQNPSFEDYSNCPSQFAQINFATNWGQPPFTTGTPDYYNSCNAQYFGVPNSVFGNQEAFTGNAYVGIVTVSLGDVYREYIQTQLSTPLIAGQTYYVSFYVSLADSSRYASNNIGVVFTVDALNGNNSSLPLSILPNINSTDIISDKLGWTEISGTYVAQGNENYLTIGNYFNDNDTQTELLSSGSSPQAYYYIDNISVSTNLGVNDFNKKKLAIYPNPVVDKFSIFFEDFGSGKITDITIYSQYNIVKHFATSQDNFDIRELPSGIYYVSLVFEDSEKAFYKIIKK